VVADELVRPESGVLPALKPQGFVPLLLGPPDQLDPAGLEVVRRCPWDLWARGSATPRRAPRAPWCWSGARTQIALDNHGRPTAFGSCVIPLKEWAERERNAEVELELPEVPSQGRLSRRREGSVAPHRPRPCGWPGFDSAAFAISLPRWGCAVATGEGWLPSAGQHHAARLGTVSGPVRTSAIPRSPARTDTPPPGLL